MSEVFLHGVRLLEVETGARPIRTVNSSIIGIVGAGDSDEIAATLAKGAGNSGLVFTAAVAGAAGNDITVTTVNPGTNNAVLDVTVVGNAITISLATSGAGVATSTASLVLAAVNADVDATTLVDVTLADGGTGAGLYAAHTASSLAGGADESFPLDTPVLVTSARDIDAKVGSDTYLGKAIEAIYKQIGAVCVVVRTEDVAGDATEMTGVYALKRAQADVGYTPRVIIADGASDELIVSDVKSVAASLRAVAIIGLTTEASATDATAWVTANGNDRTFALWPTINGGEDPAPYVAGLIAKVDNDLGFWWSPSNHEVFGLVSLDMPVDFQLSDTTSLANVLNEGKVATFIRQGGFRLWGNLTGSIDPRYQFISVRRTADIINDSIVAAHMWAVDRNITKTYLDDVSEGVTAYLRTLTNLGAVLGGKCWPDPDLNSPDQIALGKVYFNFDFTPPYPAQTITFRSILTNDYLTEII